MKSTLLSGSLMLALAAGFCLPTQSAESQWRINPDSSSIKFHIKNLGLPLSGKFTRVTGAVTYDSGNLSASTVQASVDTGSIQTGLGLRDHHLRSKDFFNVSTFPNATFSSSKIDVKPSGDFQITGTLTLHGVKQEVTLSASPLKEKVDKDGHSHMLSSASTSLLRKVFGIGGLAAMTVSNNVKVDLVIDLVKP